MSYVACDASNVAIATRRLDLSQLLRDDHTDTDTGHREKV